MNISAKVNGRVLNLYIALAWLLYLSGVAFIVVRTLHLNQPQLVISAQQNFMEVILPSIVISYMGAVSLFCLISMKARFKGRRPKGFVLPWLIILFVPLPSTFGTISSNGISGIPYYGTILLMPFICALILVIWIDHEHRNKLSNKN